jgi:hypothetical protein
MGEIADIDPQEEWKLLVGGEWTSTSGTYEVVDPNTTAVVGHAPDGSVADAEATVAAAMFLVILFGVLIYLFGWAKRVETYEL